MNIASQTKKTVKNAIAAVFGEEITDKIVKNRRRFNKVCDAYMARHATQRELTLDDDNYRRLVEDGVVVLENVHPPELIKRLHDTLLPMMESIRLDQADPEWNTLVYREDGIYRLQDFEQLVPDVLEVTQHPYVRKLVQHYINEPLRVDKVYADYKPDLVHDHTTQLHFDTWTTTIKVFTLLKDVTEANAPLAYWTGSHKDGEWRRRFDHLIWTGDYVGTAGHVPTHVLRDQATKDPEHFREKIVTGKAGQVVIADVRGIHRASNLRENYRLELVQKIAP